ncbi:hypothetical protein [Dactylosporangium sp. CA-233914]|uniref:hypothetical protein n=1 Tax=Dactylosporangium sp. CA-233914 TaxID=3239934 RepID=UPI003D8BFC4D
MAYPGPPAPHQPRPAYPAAPPPAYGPPAYGPPYGPPPAYGHPGAGLVPPSPAVAPAIRIDHVQGTSFGVAYPAVPSTPSGPSIGSLVAGIASILVALFATCLGVSGAQGGWGLAAAGAFTVLGVFLGGGSVGLAMFGLRQIRRAAGPAVTITGRGMAISGIVLGSIGAGLALLALLLSFATG